MISISVIAPCATFRRTISIVSDPSSLTTTTCVPVSPRRSFTMSKRQRTVVAASQKAFASATVLPFSVMRADAACGRADASFATSAA
jgi:hypothetical protein